jgi:cellulose biosynthesis protein BcsQ
MIITVFNDSKDVSRSILATNLAVACAKHRRTTALIDASESACSLNWCVRRNLIRVKPGLAAYVAQAVLSGLADPLSGLRRRHRDLVIDADGSDSLIFEASLLVTDVLIVPIPLDRSGDENVRDVERRLGQRIDNIRLFNPALKVMAVELRSTTGEKPISTDQPAMVRPPADAVWAETVVHQSIARKSAFECGISVMDDEARDQQAATEMNDLFREALNLAAAPIREEGIDALVHAIQRVAHWQEGVCASV